MGQRPNVVVMVADDHRMGAMGAQGDPCVQTPVFDQLIAQGASFDRTHITGAFYGAVCAPSRASILTGNGVFSATASHEVDSAVGSETVNPALATMPKTFRQAGYHTHAVGKWHNDRKTLSDGFASGSRLFFGGMSDHHAVPLREYDPEGIYPNEAVTIGEGFSSEIFADAAIDFIDTYADDDPFFLYVAFTAPHDPRTPPSPYAEMYDPATISLPPNAWARHPFDNGEMKVRDEGLAAMPRDPAEVRRHIADYYGMISHLDAQVGRVLDALDRQGVANETIVVYTADHGLAVGQHGLMGKQNLYQHSITVPLLMRGPGIGPGQRVSQLTANIDLFPTLCALTGIDVPGTVQGTSLLPVLAPDTKAIRSSVFAAYRDVQRTVSDGRWKLIRYWISGKTGQGTEAWQLFDLEADPWECNDLSGTASVRGEAERLHTILQEWQAAVDDMVWSEDLPEPAALS
ncbi:MAG: sulfatase-like hydrolase/transferase [Thermomicrobiales bacterium]